MNLCHKCNHVHRNNIYIGIEPFPKCGCGVDNNTKICICDAPYTLEYWIEKKEIEK